MGKYLLVLLVALVSMVAPVLASPVTPADLPECKILQTVKQISSMSMDEISRHVAELDDCIAVLNKQVSDLEGQAAAIKLAESNEHMAR